MLSIKNKKPNNKIIKKTVTIKAISIDKILICLLFIVFNLKLCEFVKSSD